MTVTHATNGIDGLHEAQTADFDVIILDIMLPLKDGFEVLAELRGQGHTVPIIILSAKHSVEERVKGLQSGADDYLVKPLPFLSSLRAAIPCLDVANQQQHKY